MDIVEKLRQETLTPHVAFTEFNLKLKKKEGFLFCFFEGKDDHKYYGIRVSNTCHREYDHIACGGKEGVIRLKEMIQQKAEYKNIPIAYFIDKDYGERNEIEDIYCLPTYSIENQYANLEVLSKILIGEFSLSEEDHDYETAISLFNSLQSKFHEDVTFINAWLACQNDNKKAFGVNTYLQIDSKIGNYFKAVVLPDLKNIKCLSELNDLETLQSIFSDAPHVELNKLSEKINLFKKEKPECIYRGKFEMLFFICFLNRIKEEMGKKKGSIFRVKHKCSLRFENKTVLTSLSIYAITPKCLSEYLTSFRKDVS